MTYGDRHDSRDLSQMRDGYDVGYVLAASFLTKIKQKETTIADQ